MEKDPVCGMSVNKNTALHTDYNGKTYYFCSNDCMEKFKEAPDKYVEKKSRHRC